MLFRSNTAIGGYTSGVKADLINGRLVLRATSQAMSDGSTVDGKVIVAAGSGATALGLTAGTYYAPMLAFGPYTDVPTFGSGDSTPAPSGSIWIKTSSVGGGAKWAVKTYNSTKAQFVSVSAPLYASREAATYALDYLNGGLGVASGSVFVQYGTKFGYPATFRVFERTTSGVTKVTAASAPATTFTIGNTFELSVSQAGSDVMTTYSFTINSTTAAGFVALVLGKNIPNVFAQVESNGAISFTHRAGGDIVFTDTSAGADNPISTAGINTSVNRVYYETSGDFYGSLRASNWGTITDLTFSSDQPYVAPDDGTLWYYANAYEADVMICGQNGWKGYRTVSSDARGFDLTLTDPSGPIFSPTQPTLQSNGNSVVSGDLWVDTGDLENFPKMYRYSSSSGKWTDRKSTRLNSSHIPLSRMPSSA